MEDSSNRPTACNITVLVLLFLISFFVSVLLSFFLSFVLCVLSFVSCVFSRLDMTIAVDWE